ncbi:MAG: HD domain-containing phosphohydrolase, partial [Syntrophomonas sp.]
PFNFQHLYDLVDAEIKAWEGKYDESFRLFEKAIHGAKENKRPYHYALACELAGQQYHKTGIERIAGFYLKEAYSAYLAWGATGKTKAMKEKYQHILFSGMDSAKIIELSSSPSESININTFNNSIDLNAIIQATQMISGEIEKKKLLEKLMSIIIENSGSNRGYILIRDENRWILSAYKIVNGLLKIIIDDQEILLESIDSKHLLPISIISYVMRTKEPLIIGNIQASQFSSDKYYSKNSTISATCFPILFHSVLKGIIYLENDLLTEAYSQERFEIINIFASQAAISLENSILYSELEEKVKERTAELEKANQIVIEREERLRLVLEGITDGFWDWNIKTGKICRSGRWVDILGYSVKEIEPILHTWEKHIHPDDAQDIMKALNDYLNGQISKYETEYRIITKSGDVKWILERGRVVSRNENGEPLRMVGACSDITDRKQAEAEIRYLSYHDKLTGLYNRTFFEEELKRVNTKRQLPLGLIIGDVNGLKLINDAMGHLEGDKVLIKAAEIFRKSCRQEDIISRWGGDEFIVLLPQCDSVTTLKVYKRIYDSFISINSLPILINISLGMAIQDSLDRDIKDVIREAEEKMYRNKLLESRSTRSSFIKSLEKTLWERSHETEEHCQRMQEIAQKIGRTLELTDSELDNLKLLAALHDIGKIAIPNSILDKPGKLSPEEWETIKNHPEIGYRIALSSPELAPIAEAILHHHEWWNGKGYPLGLKGEKIPLISRIIAITDAYDVMTNDRPYKKAMGKAEALTEIRRCAGTQFDPELVRKGLVFD